MACSVFIVVFYQESSLHRIGLLDCIQSIGDVPNYGRLPEKATILGNERRIGRKNHMDSEQLVSALNAIVHRLVLLANEDAQLRSDLRTLAQAVLTVTEAPDQQITAAAVEESSAVEVVEAASPVVATEPAAAVPQTADPAAPFPAVLPELTLGQAKSPAQSASISYPEHWARTGEFDLSLIESRCHLKTEGARWAATRRRLLAEGADYQADIEPMDQDIIVRAKTVTDCFLWMCHPSGPSPANPKLYEVVASCFENMANALSVVRQIEEYPETLRTEFERSLDLLAEAQSALRVAIDTIDGQPDADQVLTFNWLRAITSERQIFIERHMRISDPADPDQWSDLEARIETLDADVQAIRERNKKQRKLLGKVRHKASLIGNDAQAAQAEWTTLITIVQELVDGGMPPSNRVLRELLSPIIDDLPDDADVPPGFQLVLREIDRVMASYPLPETKVEKPPTEEVREAARRLNDRSLVIIGGDRRDGASKAIKEAFGLKDLLWIETREHESFADFEPFVARSDVAAVLLAIRWASHSYGEVKEFCDRYEKPLVRLPGGYGLNQVAAQIMAQCSERLPSQ
jgi:hypothetical protein